MAETPIIDAACEASRQTLSIFSSPISKIQDDYEHELRCGVIAALRAALPWEPPAERLEAMAIGVTKEGAANAWHEMEEHERAIWRGDALAAYRADPIMRELYPEQFR